MKTIEVDLDLKSYSDELIDIFLTYVKSHKISIDDVRIYGYFPAGFKNNYKLLMKLGARSQHHIDAISDIISRSDISKIAGFSMKVW